MTSLVLRRLTKSSSWSNGMKRRFYSTVPLSVLGTTAAAVMLLACHETEDEKKESSSLRSEETNTIHKRQDSLYTSNSGSSSSSNGLVQLLNGFAIQSSSSMPCQCEAMLKRQQTIARMDRESITDNNLLESRYDIKWNKKPLGVGASGKVYFATKKSAEKQSVAIKKIDKSFTDRETFHREMATLLDIRAAGGHPNICGLQEHYNIEKYYYLVLDLIGGGELFDNLIANGGYSEADAARLVREAASALAFLHGIGVVHADLKPENLMLSTANREDAVVKLVDFGSASTEEENDRRNKSGGSGSFTPAYCPPEVLSSAASFKITPKPSQDMWALGVILYIMLTGVHPYDLTGDAHEDEISERIMNPYQYKVPLSRKSSYTNHLSPSAIDILSRLMDRNPETRITAHEMLNHPWVRGKTATARIMTGSNARLNLLKNRMQRRFFENVVHWSDDDDETRHKTDLIERSYSHDAKRNNDKDAPSLSMSDFSNVLLTSNMNSQYYSKGHTMYHEGDIGDHMYFINSGKVEVTTKDGFTALRSQGDFFGEGALLDNTKKKRSATITCKTPVHAIQINREYFKKVIEESESADSTSRIFQTMREKDNIRKKNRTKVILRLQKNLQEIKLKHNEKVFGMGDNGDSLFIVDKGKVDLTVKDKLVFSVKEGNVFGENSLLTGRHRNSSAFCQSKDGCIIQNLDGKDFRKVVEQSPNVKESISDLCRRRDFKKSIVLRLNKDFPYDNPQEAFDAVDFKKKGYLEFESVAALLREFDPSYTDDEIEKMVLALDLNKDGKIEFDEFNKVFVADILVNSS